MFDTNNYAGGPVRPVPAEGGIERFGVLLQQMCCHFGVLLPAQGTFFRNPAALPTLISRRRTPVLVDRVRCLALVFSGLAALWIAVDVWGFPAEVWRPLMLLRLLTSAAFLWLFVWATLERDNWINTRLHGGVLAALLAIPGVFFLLSQGIVAQFQPVGFQEAMVRIYAFLPFLMMAGLALFPLTLLEASIYGLLVLVIQGVAIVHGEGGESFYSGLGALWLLLLIGAVALAAGIWQLSLLAALSHQQFHDPLTDALSRRCTEEMLDHHFALSIRENRPLAVAFVDLDCFKAINDGYGHETGDLVLRNAAQSVRNSLRRSNLLGRWGGEEFLVILPGADRGAAFQAVARICQAGLGQRPDGQIMTASIGLAERLSDGVRDWRRLVELADTRMYTAKAAGRNRVVVA